MSSNDFVTPENYRDGGAVPGPGVWLHGHDPRRVDTIEALRLEPRVTDGGARTTNAELQTRVLDLSRENSEIINMLAVTGIATVFVDRQLKVLRFTQAANEILHLTSGTIGRPLGGIVPTPVGRDRIVEVAQSVLESLSSKQLDVQGADGRWYLMHVYPYRVLDRANDGVVFSFVDITERRKAEQEIAGQLTEKETLLKEVHHRVRNNIASIAGLLSIQAQSTTNLEARTVLQGALGRVEIMSVLYNKLLVSKEYEASSAKDYLESVADSVMSLFPAAANTTLEKHVADFDVTADSLFLLGLITNELLTNVMKYAFNGRGRGLITLALERSGNRATLIVQDDGMGFPPGFDPESANGFGLSLVRMLSEQLGGNFSISSRSGTRSVLEFECSHNCVSFEFLNHQERQGR